MSKEIKRQIFEADDLVEIIEYESAGTNWQNIQDEDLILDTYKHTRRATQIIYSSESVGYKIIDDYEYMNPRASRKYGAVKNISEAVEQL